MEEPPDFIFDFANVSKVISDFEKSLKSFQSMNDLKFRFYKVFSKSKLHNHHKLIYGIILLESLDENLNDLGNFIIREYFQTCAQNQINDFFEFIELLDPHFKYYIISVISLIPDLTNINRPSYTQFVRNMKFLLKGGMNNDTNVNLDIDMRLCQKDSNEQNPLIQAIIEASKNDESKCDFCDVLTKKKQILTNFMVCEACVYLARIERHPNVQTFNFMTAIKKLKMTYLDTFLGCLFELRDLLDAERVNIITINYSKVFKQPFLIRDLLRYRNYPNFVINFLDTTVTHPEAVEFTALPHECVDYNEVYPDFNLISTSPFLSLSFIGLILSIYNAVPERAIKIIRAGISKEPDLLLLGIMQQKKIQISGHVKKILHEILIYYIKTERTSMVMLKYLWKTCKYKDEIRLIIIQSLQEYFSQNFSDSSFRLNRILDITQALDATNILLQTASLAFTIELAFAASRKSIISLSFWLQVKYLTLKEQFINALFSYLLKHHSSLLYADNQHLITESARIQQNTATLDDTLTFLYNNRMLLNKDQNEKITNMYENYYHISNYAPRRSPDPCVDKYEDTAKVIAILFETIPMDASDDVKFNNIDQFLTENVLKNSKQTHSFTLYYIGKVLTDPNIYRFINDVELHIVACLFMKMLEFNFVSPESLIEFADSMFNEYPTNSRYFFCAVTIVTFCYEFLEKSPSICARWINSTFYHSLPPFIRFCAEYTHFMGSIPVGDSGNLPFTDPSLARSKNTSYITEACKEFNPPNLKSLLISELRTFGQFSDRLEEGQPESFPKPPQNSKSFNLLLTVKSDNNFDKIPNFQIEDEYLDWFAWEFVNNVIPINLDKFSSYYTYFANQNLKNLYDAIRKASDLSLKKILKTYKYPTDNKELRMLYNLALWFGFITIGSDKLPSYKEINMKHLLIEANFKSQQDVLLILPALKNYLHFLKNKTNSMRYNPFVYEIYRVLKEIYMRFDAKIAIKLEIEVLFRMLEINIKSIEPSKYHSYPEILYKMNPYLPWNEEQKKMKNFHLELSPVDSLPYEKVFTYIKSGFIHNLRLEFCPKECKEQVSKTLEDVVKRVGTLLLDRCSDNISALVFGIVSEDFRKDPNENKLRFCARTLGKSLCLSQANVMLKSIHFNELCKLLKEGVTNIFIAKIEVFAENSEREHIETIVYEICQNNIDYIVAAALVNCTESIVASVELRLKKEFDIRRSLTEKIDFSKRVSSLNSEKILEKHKVKMFPPSQNQVSVYNDLNRHMPGFPLSEKHLLEKEMILNDKINISSFLKFTDIQKSTVFSIFKFLYDKLFTHQNSFQDENKNNIDNLLKILNYTITSSAITFFPVVVGQIVNCLFYITKNPDNPKIAQQVSEDILQILLQFKCCTYLTTVLKLMITSSFLELSYVLRYNIEVVLSLLSKNLLVYPNLDEKNSADCYTARIKEFPEYCYSLLNKLLVDDRYQGISTPNQFTQTIVIFTDIANSRLKFSDSTTIIENDLSEDLKVAVNVIDAESSSYVLFQEWVMQYYSENCTSNVIMIFKLFMLKLAKAGFLASDHALLGFIRNILKVAFSKACQSNDQITDLCNTFQILDSLLLLIVFLVKFKSDKDGFVGEQKVSFFCQILEVVRGYIVEQSKDEFNNFYSHVFEKLMLGLVTEISRPDIVSENVNLRLISCLNGFLHTLALDETPWFLDSFLNVISDKNLWNYSIRPGYREKSALYFSMLLCDILKYARDNYTDEGDNTNTKYNESYKRIVKIFSDLTAVYPQFIAFYYIPFINNLHIKFNNLRNIILSAVPEKAKLQFGINVDYDCPRVFSQPHIHIPPSLFSITENYLKTGNPVDYISLSLPHFQNVVPYPNFVHDSSFLNEYTYYLCCVTCEGIIQHKSSLTPDAVKSTIAFKIISQLAASINQTSLYTLLSSLVSHIRYATTHTAFFIYVLQNLFITCNNDTIKEKILRILFERILVVGPHPSGLIYITSKFLTESVYHLKTLKFLKDETIFTITEKVRQNLSLGVKTK